MGIYDFTLTDNKGNCVPLEDYRGAVLVIVNTATRCGFTPQYTELENMYKRYREHGMEVIDIPCNQFGAQTPEDDEGVQEFCKLHYDTHFIRMQKADVNGENELPLYTYLKEQQGFKGMGSGAKATAMKLMLKAKDWNYADKADIKWNFTKFVVNRKGEVVARFEPTHSMQDLEECVVKCLSEK